MIRYLKNIAHFVISVIVSIYYRFPGKKLKVIGITGTDGKTTTVHLIYEILKTAGYKVSLVSTIEAIINSQHLDTGLHVTSPQPSSLQKFMHQAVRSGSEYFVLEVTSHGLDQHRIWGTSIDIALINNISHEHLDYHHTFTNYRNAKAKILTGAEISVLNADDPNYEYLKGFATGKMVSFAIDNRADYRPENFNFRPRLPGKFNLYNCLAASTVASLLGIDKKTILQAVSSFTGIPGRMEEIKTTKPFKIFIDFAHKPNALEQVLKTSRLKTSKKLIVIFGCAGLRDRLKRPMMGEIAARLADCIILTAEDPRREDVRDIIHQIVQGCLKGGGIEKNRKDHDSGKLSGKKCYFWRIPDRQEAINFAVRRLAKAGDLILLCGKGHEKSMAYGNIEFPWDEKQAIEKAIYGSVKTAA